MPTKADANIREQWEANIAWWTQITGGRVTSWILAGESEHDLKPACYPPTTTTTCGFVTSRICHLTDVLLYKGNLRKVTWILQIPSPLSKGPPTDLALKTGQAAGTGRDHQQLADELLEMPYCLSKKWTEFLVEFSKCKELVLPSMGFLVDG